MSSALIFSPGAAGPLLADWRELALCAQTDPDAFFPDKGGSTREAKKVCMACEVRVECLEYALDRDERFGIWGGKSERERRTITRLRRREHAAVHEKACVVCGVLKPLAAFHRRARSSDGHEQRCKACRAPASREQWARKKAS